MKKNLIIILLLLTVFQTIAQTIDHYSQWALRKPNASDPANRIGGMDVMDAWTLGATGQNIKIAVIDQGVDLSHPDLMTNLLEGYDATKSYTGVDTKGGVGSIQYPHGTNCAGIIGAAKNGYGVVGVAPDAKIIPIKAKYATNSQGDFISHKNAWVADAIIKAVDMGADVISYSYGNEYSSAIYNAFQYAWKKGRGGKGTVIVVAAGNTEDTDVPWTGTLEGTLTVGASTENDSRLSNTRFGEFVDVYAPGINIWTTDPQGGSQDHSGDYFKFYNTSSACPNAAGVVALMLSINPNLTFDKVISLIKTTSDKVGGINRVNALKAVAAAKQSTRPMVTPVSNPNKYNYGYYNSEQFYVEAVPNYLDGYTYHWRIASSQSCGSSSGPRFWSNGNGTTAITTENKINVNTGNCTGAFYIYCEAVSSYGVRGYSSRRINVSGGSGGGGGTGDPCSSNLMAYPNPSNEKGTVIINLILPPDDCNLHAFNSESNSQGRSEIIDRIEVINLSGKIVHRVSVNQLSHKLDFSDFDNGIYYLTVFTSQSKILRQKIIKN